MKHGWLHPPFAVQSQQIGFLPLLLLLLFCSKCLSAARA
jgi:hypothetical protein